MRVERDGDTHGAAAPALSLAHHLIAMLLAPAVECAQVGQLVSPLAALGSLSHTVLPDPAYCRVLISPTSCFPPCAAVPYQQDEALTQVQSILGCSSTTARALLIFFSWDAETVLGAYRR